MCGVWICVVIRGMHDVMYSGGKVWDGDGRCLELNGSVSGCRMGTVPGAMMIKMLYGRKRRGVD